MKMRYLICTAFLLLELPILVPIVVGAVITGLLHGLQVAGQHARALFVKRQSPTTRPQASRVRPAIG